MTKECFGSMVVVLFVAISQCAQRPSSDWFCDPRWTEGRAVIGATVLKIKPASQLPLVKRNKFKLSGFSIQNLLRIRIDKAYRDDFGKRYAIKPDEILVPNLQSPAGSSKSFKVGEKYLFYLNAITELKDDLVSFYVDPNGQTAPVSEAADAMSFLENASKRNFMTEVLGYDAKDEIIGGGIIGGKAVSLPKPVYPDDAKKFLWRGAVRVAVLLDETGQVIRAKALCVDLDSVARSSETAALRSKYAPIMVSGKPIKVGGVIVYNFVP
jgi:hypothetical protein